MTTIIHRGAKAKIRCLRNKPGMQPPELRRSWCAPSHASFRPGCWVSAPFLSSLPTEHSSEPPFHPASRRVQPATPASRSPRRGYGGRKTIPCRSGVVLRLSVLRLSLVAFAAEKALRKKTSASFYSTCAPWPLANPDRLTEIAGVVTEDCLLQTPKTRFI